jgi:hypothetical protein
MMAFIFFLATVMTGFISHEIFKFSTFMSVLIALNLFPNVYFLKNFFGVDENNTGSGFMMFFQIIGVSLFGIALAKNYEVSEFFQAINFIFCAVTSFYMLNSTYNHLNKYHKNKIQLKKIKIQEEIEAKKIKAQKEFEENKQKEKEMFQF